MLVTVTLPSAYLPPANACAGHDKPSHHHLVPLPCALAEDREAYVVAKQQADPTYQIPQQVLDARAAEKTTQLARATRLAQRQQFQQLPMLGMGGLDDLVAADMCDDLGHVLAAAAAAGGGVGGVAVGVSAYSHMSLDEMMAMMQGDDDVHGVVGLWQQVSG